MAKPDGYRAVQFNEQDGWPTISMLMHSHQQHLNESGAKRTLGLRISEFDHARLDVLSTYLDVPRSSLARDILSGGITEAFNVMGFHDTPETPTRENILAEVRDELASSNGHGDA